MLTSFGKFCRKLRIDRNEILKDMAEKLGVTAAYLSAVEVGRRKVPEKWLGEIQHLYGLTEAASKEMRHAYDQSVTQVTIDLANQSASHREAAMVFARELESINEEDVKLLLEKMKIMGSNRK